MQAVRDALATIPRKYRTSDLNSLEAVAEMIASEERESHRNELDGFSETIDEAADKLVEEFHTAFNESFRSFSDMFKAIHDSKDMMDLRWSDITRATDQLGSQTNEIQSIWAEYHQTRKSIAFIDKIDELLASLPKLKKYMAERRFVKAVAVVNAASDRILQEDLIHIGALSELRHTLVDERHEMHERLTSELISLLYMRDVKIDVAAVMLEDELGEGAFADASDIPTAERSNAAARLAAKRATLNIGDGQNVREDDIADPSNAVHAVAVLLEALSRMNRCTFAVTQVIKRLHHDVRLLLDACIEATVQYVRADRKAASSSASRAGRSSHALAVLLKVVSVSVMNVLRNHSYLLRAAVRHMPIVQLYNLELVWSTMQLNIETMLRRHFGEETVRRGQRSGGVQAEELVFRFAASESAVRALAEEDDSATITVKALPESMCERGPDVVVQVFASIQRLCDDADVLVRESSGSERGSSILRESLDESIHTLLLPHVRERMLEEFAAAVDVAGAFHKHEHAVSEYGGGALVHSLPSLHRLVQQAVDLVRALPPYLNDLCALVADVLQRYLGRAQAQLDRVSGSGACSLLTSKLVLDDADTQLRQSKFSFSQEVCLEFARRAIVDRTELLQESFGVTQACLLVTSMDWLFVQLALVFGVAPDAAQASRVSGARRTIGSAASAHRESVLAFSNVEWSADTIRRAAASVRRLSASARVAMFVQVRLLFAAYLAKLNEMPFYCDEVPFEPEPAIGELLRQVDNLDSAVQSLLSDQDARSVYAGLDMFVVALLMDTIRGVKRINKSGVLRLARNIFAVQQRLASLPGVSATPLARLRGFIDLLLGREERVLAHAALHGDFFLIDDYRWVLSMRHGAELESDNELLVALQQAFAKNAAKADARSLTRAGTSRAE